MKKLTSALLCGYGLSALAPMVAQQASDKERPNILFIITDQQSFNMMSCTGNKWLKTPNMDRLANNGYRFEKTYCTNPVSMPSRFSLITGRYTTDVGVKGNVKTDPNKVLPVARESSMGNLLLQAGYQTLYSGKTHLYSSKDLVDYGFTLNGTDPYKGPADYAERFFTTYNAKSEKPFLLYLSFMNPHDICYDAGYDPRYPDRLKPDQVIATQYYIDLQKNLSKEEYKKQIPPVPANVLPNGSYMELTQSGSGSRDWTNDQWDFYRWMYHRLTEDVDTQIGRVLAALDKSGAKENTIIIFTSDHGEMNQSHGLVHKSQLLEECQRVPFIFTGKNIKKGYVDKENLATGFDVVPTICDLAGAKIPNNIPGISLKPLITGKKDKTGRNYIIVESSSGYQIHDGRYKYSIFEKKKTIETLMDIVSDPGELTNLADNPKYEEIKNKLKSLLMANLEKRNLLPLSVYKKSK